MSCIEALVRLAEGVLAVVSTAISSLAWPTAVVVLVWFFRRPLTEVLASVESFEWLGLKAKLRRAEAAVEAAELRGEVAGETGEPPSPLQPSDPTSAVGDDEKLDVFRSRAREDAPSRSLNAMLAEVSGGIVRRHPDPVGQIEWAWARLEDSLARFYESEVGESMPGRTVSRLAMRLWQHGLLDDDFLESVDALASVRHEIMHSGRANRSAAKDFTGLALRLRVLVDNKLKEWKS